jgi:hypothetical protein
VQNERWPEPTVACSLCRGSGRIDVAAPTPNVDRSERYYGTTAPALQVYRNAADCPRCKGTGRVLLRDARQKVDAVGRLVVE